jgi:hypothetical protein
MLGKLDIYMLETEIRSPFIILYKKSIQSGSRTLTLTHETKLLEEKIEKTFQDVHIGSGFLSRTLE